MAAFFVGNDFVTSVTTPTPSCGGLCVPLVFVIVGLGFVDFWNAKGEKYD
jgi:hypothetical protein